MRKGPPRNVVVNRLQLLEECRCLVVERRKRRVVATANRPSKVRCEEPARYARFQTDVVWIPPCGAVAFMERGGFVRGGRFRRSNERYEGGRCCPFRLDCAPLGSLPRYPANLPKTS